MTLRVLAIADEVAEARYGEALDRLNPDLIVSAGDLPFEYLENLVNRTDRPLLFVPGNHDPDVKERDPMWSGLSAEFDGAGPQGCISADGRLIDAAGLRIAGLGGSIRYGAGPNQYTQREMSRRALALELEARLARRKVDILLTHSAPAGYGDSADAPHRGLEALTRLAQRLQPRLLVHGHVNHYGPKKPDLRIGDTVVVNAIPYRLIEI